MALSGILDYYNVSGCEKENFVLNAKEMGMIFLSAALESPPEGPRSKSYPFLWHSKRNFPFHSRSNYNNQEFHSVLCNFGGLSGNSAIACNKFLNWSQGPFDRGNMVFLCSRLKADCRNTYHLDTKTCFSLFDSFDFFRSGWFSCNGAFLFKGELAIFKTPSTCDVLNFALPFPVASLPSPCAAVHIDRDHVV